VLRAGVGLSTERDSARAAREAAAAAMRSGRLDRADLVLVFATTPHGPGFTQVTRLAGLECGTPEVLGCSAAGVLAGEQEVEGGPGVAVLAVQGNLGIRRFFVPLARGEGSRIADAIADAVGPPEEPGQLLLLFADSYAFEPDRVFARLAERLPGVRVVGGGASEDGSVGGVSVFSGNAASGGVVAGALLGGDIRATVGVSHALRRVGRVRRITRACDANVILEIDDRPAYEAFAEIVPGTLLEDLRRATAVVLVGLAVGEGEVVARHLIAVDPQRGAIAVNAAVSEGQEVFFGVRDPQGARADLQRVLARQAAEWRDAPAAGALYVNCVGRGRGFHGVSGLDTAYIRQQLGPMPVAGFFSGAEFAPAGGVPRLHQYTGVLTVLGSVEGTA
jgi:small ligand-binding sensory domain FIST